jgi:hypothetical protein
MASCLQGNFHKLVSGRLWIWSRTQHVFDDIVGHHSAKTVGAEHDPVTRLKVEVDHVDIDGLTDAKSALKAVSRRVIKGFLRGDPPLAKKPIHSSVVARNTSQLAGSE